LTIHFLKCWEGSEAERRLKRDIDAGIHAQMKPQDFYNTGNAYKKFSIVVFRKHIEQELKR